jgi:hypothetical protein
MGGPVSVAGLCPRLFQAQSASAKALHQPFLLTSPSTTLQYFGGSNNVQVAQL